jgi:hypothetical protein
MIVTYNPLAQQQQEDINTSISRSSAKGDPGLSRSKWLEKVAKNLRNPFSVNTEGEQNLPSEIAPLIFSNDKDEKFQMKEKERSWDKLNGYFDKRARARYVCLSITNGKAPSNKLK